MKKVFLSLIVVAAGYSVDAQFVYDYLKAGNDYYAKGDYFSAAQYYEKYFGKDSAKEKPGFHPYSPQPGSKKKVTNLANKDQVIWQLAECYRLLNYPEKAEPYYQELLDMEGSTTKFPLVKYRMGTTQRALAKYDEAEESLKSFVAGYPVADDHKKSAGREIENIAFIKAQTKKKDLKYYSLHKAPAELNSVGASYAPAWLNASTLLFTSTRPEDSTAKNKNYVNRVYQAVYSEDSLAGIERTKVPQGKGIHQGVVSLSPDGNTIYLTRWTIGAGNKKTSALYVSNKKGDEWSDPVMLDDMINAAGSNTQEPFVTADGKYLLFASDRSGGRGGFDIWYAPITEGRPGTPVNIGDQINTEFDERAPFYHEASQSLVFSANGRVGMGNFDFFQSKGTIDKLATPVNFGYPVNSIKDDIYFVSRGGAKNILEDVMISSDREAACCLELFYLKKIRPLRQLSGRVVSCDAKQPLKNATVTITEASSGKVLHTAQLGAGETYSFAMEDYVPVTIKADAAGFISNSASANGPADMEDETYSYPDLCLNPVPPQVNETFVIENVYFDFNKSEVKPESFPALDEVVRMLNTYPTMVIEIGGHTDNVGNDKYNQRLSEARARSVVSYLASKGIDENRLQAKGYGEAQPIEPNRTNGRDNPEGREKNRRTEFKVLQN